MTNHAPLKIISTKTISPHDTTRKLLERRHGGRKRRTAEDKLRILCNLQGMLIELNNEKAEHGNA